MLKNFGAIASEKVVGLAQDIQVRTGLDFSELTPTTRESSYIVGVVGFTAVVTLVTMTVKHVCNRVWDKDGDTSVGWPERFHERQEEAIVREKEESAARKIAVRSWWDTRGEPNMTIPYMVGGMLGSLLRRTNSISDDESL